MIFFPVGAVNGLHQAETFASLRISAEGSGFAHAF